ncbi:ankyrin repeat domain-containing protein [Brachyspira hyodysenteriae]|uniref:ankyrin repeat domain-containing protein n=1 Tax=Brachyspira hyodysenteriae TaxID=159 RepID=UPI00063D9CA8|nr:ankyrin repeat domain-containing protein [Brachyspira hyodysenteriae]KLI46130.1 hypothetical protein SZ41_12235 [Brachyspira hyodysenteriae]KLI53629.1 hypothetical protein SZ42_00630 [Brachyspira hyodysenteriae]MCZ9888987.1 ankyrin repeat domain-containing protein [Brachyspira hyodysenteriae]
MKRIISIVIILILFISVLYSQSESDFFKACLSGDIKTVENYINNGGNIDAEDESGFTGLMLSSGRKHENIVDLLLKHKANPNIVHSSSGVTALILASTVKNNEKILEKLIDNGADINASTFGLTALTQSLTQTNNSNVLLLLKKGADPNINLSLGNNKTSPLIYAVENGNHQVVLSLIGAGANIDYQDNYGQTALMWACMKNKKQIVELLLASQADIYITDKKGNTALDLTNNEEILSILRKYY